MTPCAGGAQQTCVSGRDLDQICAVVVTTGLRLKDVRVRYGDCGSHLVYITWPAGLGVSENAMMDAFDKADEESS